jgi:regulator of protease activity HflC (stomatin/prohibitin superfamily)
MRIYSIIAIIIGVAVTIIFYQNSKYVLEENKQVVIVQFGNVTNITDPENIQSKREIEIEILEIAKVKLLEFGIGLAELEGKISYPI